MSHENTLTASEFQVLQSQFPHLFTDGELDAEKLQTHLTAEKYGLNFPGKTAAARAAQTPLMSKISPSVSAFPTDRNIFIAGENSEALKHLQADFSGKVKMIYIDPPYNTGNSDFVYADNFRENSRDFASENGHAHAAWLSFMYQRLLLSRPLLREDGVIFLSIDDSEQANLKLLCDEVFGEDNFIANMVRQNKVGSGHDSSLLAVEYDYILVYAKDKSKVKFNREPLDVANDKKYKLEDEYLAERGKYYLRDLDYKGSYSPSLDYPITAPDGSEMYSGGAFGKPNTWRWSRAKFEEGIENGYIVFKKRSGKYKVYIKQYQYADNAGNPRVRTLPYRALTRFLNGTGNKELTEIFGQKGFFSFPKSTEMLQSLIRMSCEKDDLILDFFGGSGTTAHAVIKQNAEDGGRRRFILVQLPEKIKGNNPARKAGYETLADLCLERVRRVRRVSEGEELVVFEVVAAD